MLPTVDVFDLLQVKIFGKCGGVDDADRGRGENGENEDGATDDLPGDIDPMFLLDADVLDELNLETPQKRKRVYKGTECAYLKQIRDDNGEATDRHGQGREHAQTANLRRKGK